MKIQIILTKLKTFREKIYNFFTYRQDAAMELVDALSSNTQAKSVVELSESEFFRRNYCSLTRIVDEFYSSKDKEAKHQKNKELSQLIASYFPAPENRNYYVFAVDCTPAPRPHSPTLKDRGFIHAPNPVPGNKPITLGHEYSIASLLPEKSEQTAAWVIPFSCRRVASDERGTSIGMEQISDCINGNEELKQSFCISLGDCAYSTPECLTQANKNFNQVHISRVKNNRNLNHQYSDKQNKKGRPKKYGALFKLNDNSSWSKSKETIEFASQTKKGKAIKIKIEGWDNLIMRGSNKMLMCDVPFRLLRVQIFREDGSLKYNRPLWIIASGKRRNELSLEEIYKAYRQRFDVEHFFRFGKRRLLMDKFQSMDIDHEEAWWQFIIISYAQLYLSRNIAERHPKPWEKYLPTFNNVENKNLPEDIQNQEDNTSPTQVQNDMARIIRGIGTPAKPPKPRKKAIGRRRGEKQIRRIRHAIINKGKKKRFNSS